MTSSYDSRGSQGGGMVLLQFVLMWLYYVRILRRFQWCIYPNPSRLLHWQKGHRMSAFEVILEDIDKIDRYPKHLNKIVVNCVYKQLLYIMFTWIDIRKFWAQPCTRNRINLKSTKKLTWPGRKCTSTTFRADSRFSPSQWKTSLIGWART